MIMRTIGKYDIVGTIGGYMVYPTGPTMPGSPHPSQLYGNYFEAESLAKWLEQRDAGYP